VTSTADAAAWVGAATGSIALGWQIVREFRSDRRRHADLVAVVPASFGLHFDGESIGPPSYSARVVNSGRHPIREVFVTFALDAGAGPDVTVRSRVDQVAPGGEEQVHAGDAFFASAAGRAGDVRISVTYRDAEGRRWRVHPSGRTTREGRGFVAGWRKRRESHRPHTKIWEGQA
jgi:hypothetical protein